MTPAYSRSDVVLCLSRGDVGCLTELVLVSSRCVYHELHRDTHFRKLCRASRLPKFRYLKSFSSWVFGDFIFDQIKKYLFIRKLWLFQVVKYLLRWPVMRPVSIGNPMGNVSSVSSFNWISYTNWIVTAHGSRYFPTLKCHNFLMKKYFLDRSKNKSPDSHGE